MHFKAAFVMIGAGPSSHCHSFSTSLRRLYATNNNNNNNTLIHHRSFQGNQQPLFQKAGRVHNARVPWTVITSSSTIEDPSPSSTSGSGTGMSSTSTSGSGSIMASVKDFVKIVDVPEHNRSLWIVASIGFLWTVSNLMVMSILPVYMKSELGLSNTSIGALEGAAIAAAFFSKVFSGLVSDLLRSRIAVIALGAFMTAAVKPMFALAGSVKTSFGAVTAFYWIFAGKIIDRLSKGVRAAPTDALLADLSPGKARNRAYSLNHSTATFGGVVGSLLCSAAMALSGNNYQLTFALATVPAVLAIALLGGVTQPELAENEGKHQEETKASKTSTSFWDKMKDASNLPSGFYFVALIISILYLGRFSESFVILRAKSIGFPTSSLPLMITVNQLVQALLTYPMGYVADKLDSRYVLVIGMLFLILANVVFISLPNTLGMILGFICVGIHMSMTQANTKSLLSSTLGSTNRGSGFAVFAILSGISLAIGNILAGYLNDVTSKMGMGLIGCFMGGGVAGAVATVLLLIYYALFRKKEKTV